MKFNVLLIINKPSVAISTAVLEYDTYESALAAVETLRQGLSNTSAYDVKYFITRKGEELS